MLEELLGDLLDGGNGMENANPDFIDGEIGDAFLETSDIDMSLMGGADGIAGFDFPDEKGYELADNRTGDPVSFEGDGEGGDKYTDDNYNRKQADRLLEQEGSYRKDAQKALNNGDAAAAKKYIAKAETCHSQAMDHIRRIKK